MGCNNFSKFSQAFSAYQDTAGELTYVKCLTLYNVKKMKL